MTAARRHQPFPVLLYAGLVAALLSLVRPAPLRAVQSRLGAVAVLPLRIGASWTHTPPVNTTSPAEGRGVTAAAAQTELGRRMARAARQRPVGIDPELRPRAVRVVERWNDGGRPRPQPGTGTGGATLLVLEAERAELRGAARMVTRGDLLVGFLTSGPLADAAGATLGIQASASDPRAIVRLLQDESADRPPRRVPVQLNLPGRGVLEGLAEPAARHEEHALRLAMLGDPYLAAELRADAGEVRTSGLRDDPLGALAGGLRLGQLRVFGYRVTNGATEELLPIGLFVEPPLTAAQLDHVIVWERRTAAGRPASEQPLVAPLRGGQLQPIRALRVVVPTVARRRFLVVPGGGFGVMPVGAAVVAESRLLGTVAESGPGYGVVTPFGQPGRYWNLLLMPDDGDDVLTVRALVLERTAGRVGLRIDSAQRLDGRSAELPQAGQLFTVGSGRHLPAALWLGSARLAPTEPRPADGSQQETPEDVPQEAAPVLLLEHLAADAFPEELSVFRLAEPGVSR